MVDLKRIGEEINMVKRIIILGKNDKYKEKIIQLDFDNIIGDVEFNNTIPCDDNGKPIENTKETFSLSFSFNGCKTHIIDNNVFTVSKQVVEVNEILRLIDNYEKQNKKKPTVLMNFETLDNIVCQISRSCENTLEHKIEIVFNTLKCKTLIDVRKEYGEIELL